MRSSCYLFVTGFALLFLTVLPVSQAGKRFGGDGHIKIYNVHLKESVSVQYRKPNGRYDKKALKEINHALRCRLTSKERIIPTDLLELVDDIEDHFNAREVIVLSGYRSPELNADLRVKGHKVAPNSLHMSGYAMDIRITGVSSHAIRDYAKFLNRGGVGYYPQNQFVHVDIGRVRYW